MKERNKGNEQNINKLKQFNINTRNTIMNKHEYKTNMNTKQTNKHSFK